VILLYGKNLRRSLWRCAQFIIPGVRYYVEPSGTRQTNNALMLSCSSKCYSGRQHARGGLIAC